MNKPKPLGKYRDLLPKEIYNLFKDTYWGNHQYHHENEKAELYELIENRINIANRYNLKKNTCITKIAKKYLKEMALSDIERKYINDYGIFMKYRDHPEYYKTKDDNIISIFSQHFTEEELEATIKAGYQLVEPIYNKNQKTLLKVIYKR